MIYIKRFEQYREQAINLSRPEEVVLMLYDGAIRFLNSAVIEYEEKKDIKGKAKSIEKAVAIIDHLQSCLDMEAGGEIAKNLDRIYDYMLIALTEANLKNDMEKIRQCRGLIETIREGWLSVCNRKNRKENQEGKEEERILKGDEALDKASALQQKGIEQEGLKQRKGLSISV